MAGEPGKLALGTVQFGMKYGVSNARGQTPPAAVRAIFKICLRENITMLDTAAAYGESETVIGEQLSTYPGSFQIISKLPACRAPQVRSLFATTLQRLQQPNLYGYLIHDFASFQADPSLFDEIYRLQQSGWIQKIGFSVYFPAQLEEVLALQLPIQLVQLPFNVFDQRFTYLFDQLTRQNIQIHVRSVFLQGLVFMATADLPPYFKPFMNRIEQLQALAGVAAVPLNHLLLAFAHFQTAINKIVIGVTAAADLRQNYTYVDSLDQVRPFLNQLTELATTDERLVLPFNWKLRAG